MNEPRYTQIGVDLSLHSGKTRSYLRHKGIPFVELDPPRVKRIGLAAARVARAPLIMATPFLRATAIAASSKCSFTRELPCIESEIEFTGR